MRFLNGSQVTLDSSANSSKMHEGASPSVSAYCLRSGKRQRAGLILMGCVVALFLCELIARLFFPAPPYPFRKPPLAFVQDPDLLHFHQPNQTGWIDDGLATINALGLRGTKPICPKPQDV